jgi:hypothetical protein
MILSRKQRKWKALLELFGILDSGIKLKAGCGPGGGIEGVKERKNRAAVGDFL